MNTVEARRSRRRVTNRAGIAKAPDKDIMVLLRDKSQTGARIRIVGSGHIPDSFRLVSLMEKIDADCTVVWRRGRDCGVKFT
jgi:hypothetical protein